MKFTLAFLLFLIPSTAYSQDVDKAEHVTHVLIATNVVAHFVDVSSTQWLMGHNSGTKIETYKESNPLMKPFTNSPITMAVAKGSFASLQGYLFIKYHKTHKKLVIIGTIISTVLTGIADYTNYKHYKEARANR